MDKLLMLGIGIFAGIASGLFGVGGGILLVPAMVLLLGMDQHTAQGTSLLVLTPPFMLIGAIQYYKEGYVNLVVALFLAIGLMLGLIMGARLSFGISELVLRRMFALLMLLVALRLFFSGGGTT